MKNYFTNIPLNWRVLKLQKELRKKTAFSEVRDVLLLNSAVDIAHN